MAVPMWIQVFYIVLAVVLLGWMGWITKVVLRHEKLFSQIFERCHGREAWIRGIDHDLGDLKATMTRMDRNVVRLGVQAGLDRGELEIKT